MKQQLKEIDVALLPVPNIIILPKTSVSFYLHDERYIKMMREVSKENGLVVLSMTDPLKNEAGEIIPNALLPRATSVLAMPSMMEEEPGGLHHGGVILKGLCKVRITKIVQTQPILICKAVILEDDLSFYDFYQHPEYLRLKAMLEAWIYSNVDDEMLKEELKSALHSPEQVINHLTLLLVECREIRQLLLETLSLYDRFEMLGLILNQNSTEEISLQTLKDFYNFNEPQAMYH